jgi:hypothetical protein
MFRGVQVAKIRIRLAAFWRRKISWTGECFIESVDRETGFVQLAVALSDGEPRTSAQSLVPSLLECIDRLAPTPKASQCETEVFVNVRI